MRKGGGRHHSGSSVGGGGPRNVEFLIAPGMTAGDLVKSVSREFEGKPVALTSKRGEVVDEAKQV